MRKNNTMTRVSLRNIASHKLRLALTLLAVVLGTAFISGAFMFTNSLDNAFKSAVSSSFDGVDAVAGPAGDAIAISAEVQEKLGGDGDVDKLNILASTSIVAATTDGEPIQTGGATSSLGVWYSPEQRVGEAYEIVEGDEPSGASEIVINHKGAQAFDVEIGQKLLIVDSQSREEMEVVGFYSSEMDQASSFSAYMAADGYAQRYLVDGAATQLILAAKEGVDADALVQHLNDTYPEIEARSGAQLAEQATELMSTALSFVNYFLIAFGLVALLVGTFLIANTFSMIVAQRTKEFALLRALGAARGQVTRSVVTEATLVGLVGSVLGVVSGMGLVAVIKAVMAAQGLAMPDSGLGLSFNAVVIPLVLGTVVTIFSAWMPARRAGAVRPVEAMRSSEAASEQSLKARTIVGAALLLVGVVAALAGVLFSDASTSHRATLVGVGAFGVIVGFFFAGPALSLPIVPSLGKLIGVPFGAMGRLAATNSRRNPRRTSATAFALTLGIALVTAIGMLGDSMKASISNVVENNVSADFVLSTPRDANFPTPREVPQVARDTEGVGEVVTLFLAPLAVEGKGSYPLGPVPQTMLIDGNLADASNTTVVEGTINLDESPGVIATTEFAESNGWSVGDNLELSAPGMSSATVQAPLVGIFEKDDVVDNMAVSTELAEQLLPAESARVLMVAVVSDGSVDDAQLRENLEEAVKSFIVVQVQSRSEMAGQAAQNIDIMLNILYALLALAVIIAILGIVNTLTLGVIERRQEIGMLRAVGSQRRQVRTMITLEAVQIAVFGAIMGVLIGLGLGWAFLEVLSGQGLDTISVPLMQIGWILLGSAAVGIFAAAWPASRAAKTPPLEAIAD